MPHESTAEPEDIRLDEGDERPVEYKYRARSMSMPSESISKPPAVRQTKALSLVAETPMKITHHHDDDEDEEKIIT